MKIWREGGGGSGAGRVRSVNITNCFDSVEQRTMCKLFTQLTNKKIAIQKSQAARRQDAGTLSATLSDKL
jgi:hypothetical protein